MNTSHEEFKAKFQEKYAKKSIQILPISDCDADENIRNCTRICEKKSCWLHPVLIDEATQRLKFAQALPKMRATIKEWIASGLIKGLRNVIFDETEKIGHTQNYIHLMPPRKTLTQKEKSEGYIIQDGKLIKP